jgi:hypothetical protein
MFAVSEERVRAARRSLHPLRSFAAQSFSRGSSMAVSIYIGTNAISAGLTCWPAKRRRSSAAMPGQGTNVVLICHVSRFIRLGGVYFVVLSWRYWPRSCLASPISVCSKALAQVSGVEVLRRSCRPVLRQPVTAVKTSRRILFDSAGLRPKRPAAASAPRAPGTWTAE